MFGFSRKTDYALVILTALVGRRKEFVSVRALARVHRLPYRFASQIVSALARARLLEAREGIRGGYRLAKAPTTITLADILTATEGSTALVSCLDARKGFRCPQKAWCTARAGVGAVHQHLVESLQKTTVADLVRAHTHAR